jgi:hypothetical protein
MNKRSCAALLPQASACFPSDYAACLLALPGCHDSGVNQSRLNKCVVLGLSPQLVHWLGVEFGSLLLCNTLVLVPSIRTKPEPKTSCLFDDCPCLTLFQDAQAECAAFAGELAAADTSSRAHTYTCPYHLQMLDLRFSLNDFTRHAA